MGWKRMHPFKRAGSTEMREKMARMSRAAITPCGGDPFVALLFLHFFKKVWSDEVDKLYVHYDGLGDARTSRYVERRFKEHPKVVWLHDNFVNLTYAMNRCFEACKEDLIVLLEDDGYIYEKGWLDIHFKKIESGEYDSIGSPRGACGHEILAASLKRFALQLDNERLRRQEPFFDPCFFFIKRSDLMKTDHHFGHKNFKKGDYIKELDYTNEVDGSIDTLGWINVQQRVMETKFQNLPLCKIFPQYNCLEDTIPMGWIHVGSLSSGWRGEYLRGRFFSPQVRGESLPDYEKRVTFWKMAVELEDYNEIGELKKAYLYGIERLIDNCGLRRERIEQMLKSYKSIL